MARKYGDVYSLKIASGTVVVLSSAPAVHEILVKNSSIVSDRPASYLIDEATWARNLVLMRYGRLFLLTNFCFFPSMMMFQEISGDAIDVVLKKS
jgi:Cytochrome P450